MDRFNTNANISSIEDFLFTQLAPKLDNIYIGFMSNVIEESNSDSYVLIDISSDIYYDVVTYAYVDIWLCAKNIENTKNSSLLKSMEDKLDDVVMKFQDKSNTYLLTKVKATSVPISDAPYYCNLITLKVTVLK